MPKDIYLLGSTGSVGNSTLKVVRKNMSKFRLKLLTTNSNVKKVYKQAIEFNVKNIVIFDKKKYLDHHKIFKKKKINAYNSINDVLIKKNKKAYITINAISGIEGLEPSINIIKNTQNLAIANKESIICGWKFIKKELNKYKTNFIPLDSEHFSIWSLLKSENIENIKSIYLTASGGPFLNRKLENIKNIKPEFALKHPNWKMGKKISIDSATMMNKIFEVIEAVKIFNLDIDKFKILIHPKSYVHSIIHFKTGLTKMLAHETTMEIPIMNALYSSKDKFKFNNKDLYIENLNNLNFIKPDVNAFPLLKILNNKINNTYFEIILVALNDELVSRYLNKKIPYISIHKLMLKLLKKPYFQKYYKLSPNNINEIKIMVNKVKRYLNNYLK